TIKRPCERFDPVASDPRAQCFEKHAVTVTAHLPCQRIRNRRKLPLPLGILSFRIAVEMKHTRLASTPDGTQPRSLLEEVDVLRLKLHVVKRIELNATLQPREGEIEDELVAPLHAAVPVNPRTRLGHRAYRTIERAQRALIA